MNNKLIIVFYMYNLRNSTWILISWDSLLLTPLPIPFGGGKGLCGSGTSNMICLFIIICPPEFFFVPKAPNFSFSTKPHCPNHILMKLCVFLVKETMGSLVWLIVQRFENDMCLYFSKFMKKNRRVKKNCCIYVQIP